MYRKKLIDLGIQADNGGFEYLNTAIEMYQPLQSMTDLYYYVGVKYEKSHSAIERAMRTAVKKFDKNLKLGAFIAKYKILWSED